MTRAVLDISDVLHGKRLEAFIRALETFPPHYRSRGRQYARAGRVGELELTAAAIAGEVQGTKKYDAGWEWNGSHWSGWCSCPMGGGCKHLFAIAYVVLAALAKVSPPAPERDEPEAKPEARTARPARTPARAKPAAAGSRARTWSAADPDHDPKLRALRRARSPWERERALYDLAQRPAQWVSFTPPPFPQILEESDPDILCWLLAQAVPSVTGGWLPPALEPFRNRADIEEQYRAQMRGELALELHAWAARRRISSSRRLRVVASLREPAGGRLSVLLEARLSSPRLDDAPRSGTQLRQLLTQAQREPGLLPADQTELLEVFVSSLESWYSSAGPGEAILATAGILRVLQAAAGTPLLTWDEKLPPALASRAGVAPGAPVTLAPRAARIVPLVGVRNGAPTLDLHCTWPDGRTVPWTDVITLHDDVARGPVLVIHAGEFATVTDAPPRRLFDLASFTGGVTLEPGRDDALLRTLSRRFEPLRESLAPFARTLPVTPIAAVKLTEDDWLQIRLFAIAGNLDWRPGEAIAPGDALFEYDPSEQWTRIESSSDVGPAGAEAPAQTAATETGHGNVGAAGGGGDDAGAADSPALLDLPDEAALTPALEWLRATGAEPGDLGRPGGLAPRSEDRRFGWWLRLGGRHTASFAAALEHLPPGVRFFCTKSARPLFDGGRPLQPRIRVKSSGLDWFGIEAGWESDSLALSDADLEKLLRAEGPFVRISSGWVRRAAGAIAGEALEALADLGLEPGAGEQRLGIWQLAQARAESLDALERFGADPAAIEAVRELRAKIAAFEGLPAVEPSKAFRGELRPYQKRGLDFLAHTASLGLGAVLADDMGLGKTVQALAWIEHLREQDPKLGPVLVVCPASVVHNWVREAARFAPGLRPVALASGAGRRAAIRGLGPGDLAVTNYALLRRDIEAWAEIPLGVAILDEAQNVKNPDAAVSRAASRLNAAHRLALTGTPLENRALDLWSILVFLNPGYLGDRASFSRRFDRAEAPPHVRRLLAAKLRPVLLRRMKQEVAPELPPRIEERLDCEMVPAQRRLYQEEAERARRLILALATGGESLRRHAIEILAHLTRLRQICCHPKLVRAAKNTGSGKFEALWELLEPLLAEGQKVLLFSQFVQCLDLIAGEMRGRDIPHHRLSGATRHRERVVAAFQDDPRPGVFLISLKAGGTGLNLTSANQVILFDPWWNPAVEAQAIDRTHRIGQQRTVIAYRLLTRGTVEEKIWELQQRKASLAREILGEDGFARSLTREDLEFLLEPAE